MGEVFKDLSELSLNEIRDACTSGSALESMVQRLVSDVETGVEFNLTNAHMVPDLNTDES